MPVPLSDEMMQYMVKKGYIIISPYQDSKLKDSEILYEFGDIPPSSDPDARHLFLELYREASKYQLVEGKVYRNAQQTHRQYRHRGRKRKR